MKEVLPGVLLVSVPKGSARIRIIDGSVVHGKGFFRLPPGQWEIVGRVADCDEDAAAGVVKRIYGRRIYGRPFFGWRNYLEDGEFIGSATESLESLAKANGFNENSLIIKKKP